MKEQLFQIGVKALIENPEGKILLLDSGKWHLKHQERHWDIPGGRIQEGETAQETLRREVKEEIGVDVHNPVFFTAVVSNFKNISVEGQSVGLALLIYKVGIDEDAKIQLSHEHDGYEWVDHSSAAKRLNYKYPIEFTKLL